MPRKARTVPWLDWRGGVAYACWYDPKARRTQRISLGQRDPRTAQAAFAEFLAKGVDVYKPSATNGLLFSAALEDYYQEHRKNKIAGSWFPGGSQAHLTEHLGHLLVKQINVPASIEYARTRAAEGASLGTIRNEVGLIKTVATHAIKYGRLTPVEMPQVEIPEAPPSRERWLTQEELAKLRAAAGAQDTLDFIDLCYWTASRKAAILQLTKFQVDLNIERIKLAKPGAVVTKKRKPIVPIAPALLPTVKRLMKETPGEYLLPKRDYDWFFYQAVKRAELEDVTPHTLRHTRISHLLQQGVMPWVVGGLAGLHPMTVVNVYGHHCPDHLQDVVKNLKGGE